jgi:hypothetical protein
MWSRSSHQACGSVTLADQITVRARPCSSCPYRCDVPSGIWKEVEYDKLPQYDGDTIEQIENRAFQLFRCHSTPDYLCAGWVGCHDMDENLAMRFNHHRVDPKVYEYESPVPLFDSGAEAAMHGLRDLKNPSSEAYEKIAKLMRQIDNRST